MTRALNETTRAAELYARALEAEIEVDYVRDVIERRQLSRFLHTA